MKTVSHIPESHFRVAALSILFVLLPVFCIGQEEAARSIAFWNVENFFDTQDDTITDDDDFTPQGVNHWTYKRYEDKRNKIYRTIAAMKWPAVMGLAEVENDRVLSDLCNGTPLRKMGYRYIHYESPDRRGVDCALLYRSKCFNLLESRAICVSDSVEGFYTRDILLVGGMMGDETCYFLVNHWPSKLGGATADRYRLKIADKLLSTMDSLQVAHPGALVLAMGDFNASSEEAAVSEGLGFGGDSVNRLGLYNLTSQVAKGEGSYKYHDTWSCIDQMFANRRLPLRIMTFDFLLMEDEKYLGRKPHRTYIGMQYQGGFSDHLPLLTTLP